jgi:tetratricopeptide (TPR) repeat protein
MSAALSGEDQARAHLQRAQMLLELGRHEEALPLIVEALRLDPEAVEIYCHLALALRMAGQRKQALAVLADALKKDPNHEWPHRLKAVTYREIGDLKLALASAQEAYRLAPDLWLTGYVLGNVLLSSSRLNQAREQSDRLRSLEPNNSHVFDLAGRVSLASKQLLEAENHFREALRLDPQNASAHNNLGNVLAEQGRTVEAVQCFERALAVNPLESEAQANLYKGARTLRSERLLATSKGLLARLSPTVYRYYLQQEQGSASVGWFILLFKMVLPVSAALALIGFTQHRLTGAINVAGYVWTGIALSGLLIFARLRGWAQSYFEVSPTTVEWISTLTAWIFNPFWLLLAGGIGLHSDESRWAMYLVMIITGVVFSVRRTLGIARGWYYGHASRLYPYVLRKKVEYERYTNGSKLGRVVGATMRRLTNPLTYIIVGMLVHFTTMHWLGFALVLFGVVFGLLKFTNSSKPTA